MVGVHVQHEVLARDAAAVGHDVDLGEDLEVPDDGLDGDDGQDRPQHRRQDGPPDPPLRGPVQSGGLQHLGGHGADPGVDRHHHEREGAPDHFEQHEEERAQPPVRPRVVPEPQNPVHRPEVGIEEQQPHGRPGDGRRGPGPQRGQHQHESRHRTHPSEQHGQRTPDGKRRDDTGPREQHGGHQHLPELTVRKQRGVVPEPLESRRLPTTDLSLRVLEERDQPKLIDRVDQQPAKDDKSRGQIQPGHTRTPPGARGTARSATTGRHPRTLHNNRAIRRHPLNPRS